jgi:hypothetical protein
VTAHGRHRKAAYSTGAHDVTDVAVIVSCSCGDLFAGDSHEHAHAQWVAHADQAEAANRRDP